MNLIETKAVYVPVAAFHSKAVAYKDERFRFFARLCAAAASKADVYDVKGKAVALKPGQLVATLEDLAKLWDTGKRVAERAIDAFCKDGLCDGEHITNRPELLVNEASGFPPGCLYTIRNYRPTSAEER